LCNLGIVRIPTDVDIIYRTNFSDNEVHVSFRQEANKIRAKGSLSIFQTFVRILVGSDEKDSSTIAALINLKKGSRKKTKKGTKKGPKQSIFKQAT